MSCFVVAAAVFSLVALLLNITAIGTVHWLDAGTRLGTFVGIFHHCDTNGFCGGMENVSAIVDAQYVVWFRVVQALFLLTAVGSLLICVVDMLVNFKFFATGSFKVSTIACLFTFLFEFTAILLFGLYYRDIFVTDSPLGFSFYTAILGLLTIFICFICHVSDYCQASRVLRTVEHRLTTVWSTPYTLFTEQEC